MDKQPRDHNEKDNDIGDDLAIQCKQSVDEDIRSMLSVTPVNVPDGPSGSQDADAPSGSQDDDAFSSSSASSGSDDESSEESEESEDSGIEVDGDAEDIDGEEDEEGDEVPLLESEFTPPLPMATMPHLRRALTYNLPFLLMMIVLYSLKVYIRRVYRAHRFTNLKVEEKNGRLTCTCASVNELKSQRPSHQ